MKDIFNIFKLNTFTFKGFILIHFSAEVKLKSLLKLIGVKCTPKRSYFNQNLSSTRKDQNITLAHIQTTAIFDFWIHGHCHATSKNF